jgi:hypothetical protein
MITTLVITGSTYSCRSELSAMGGRWVPHLDAWLVPDDQRDSAEYLCGVMGLTMSTLSVPWNLPYHRSRSLSPTTR